MRRSFAVAVAGLLALQALVCLRYTAGPQPLPADAPLEIGSAGRALAVLERLLADERPHPVGSEAGDALRGRLVAEIERLGLEVEVQSGQATRRGKTFALHNVLAHIPGREPGRPVLLATHHDSVPVGPGAGDAGACVAALLEVARVLQAGPTLRNDVLLLFTDGEEASMLGARLFTAHHPWAARDPVVVNLDARGTTGPSLMYETGPEAAWLVEHFARATARPVTGSLFVRAYERMPNYSDFTIYRDRGLTGLNFAFIGGPTRYHTGDDDLAHLDPRSLQHHLDQALALARELGDADLEQPPAGRAVYFDAFAATVVLWPEGATAPPAVVCLAVLLAIVVLRRRRGTLRLADAARGLLVAAAALALAAGGGWIVSILARAADLLPSRFVEPAWPFTSAFWALALGGTCLAARVGLRRADPDSVALGLWTGWAALACAAAFTLPGASYPLLVPVAVVTLCQLAGLPRRAASWGAVAGVLAAGAVWLPLLHMLPVALGLRVGALHAGMCAWMLGTLLPLMARGPAEEPA